MGVEGRIGSSRGRPRRSAGIPPPSSSGPTGDQSGSLKGVLQVAMVGVAASVLVFVLWFSQSPAPSRISSFTSVMGKAAPVVGASDKKAGATAGATSRGALTVGGGTPNSEGFLRTSSNDWKGRQPPVAVCIGGPARTLMTIPEVHKNLKEMFVDALGTDVVMMAAFFDDFDLDDPTWLQMQGTLGIHPDNVILYSTPPEILKKYCGEGRLGRFYSMSNSFIACADVLEKYEAKMGYKVEWVVRIRPDIVHENPLPPLSKWPAPPSHPTIYVPGGGALERNEKVNRKVCVTDTFAVVHRSAVDAYFREFPSSLKSGCNKLNMRADNECILGESLTRSRVALPACSMAYVKVLKFYGEIYGGCGNAALSDCTAVCDAAANRGVHEFMEGQEGRRGCDYISGRIDTTGNHHDRETFAKRLFGAPETAICCND